MARTGESRIETVVFYPLLPAAPSMKPEIIRVRVRVLGYCDLAKIVYSTVHGIGTRINSYSYRRPLSGRYTTATGGSSLWSESGTVLLRFISACLLYMQVLTPDRTVRG